MKKVLAKLKEYNDIFGGLHIELVLYSDGSGHLNYWEIHKKFFSFQTVKKFLESDPKTVIAESHIFEKVLEH